MHSAERDRMIGVIQKGAHCSRGVGVEMKNRDALGARSSRCVCFNCSRWMHGTREWEGEGMRSVRTVNVV